LVRVTVERLPKKSSALRGVLSIIEKHF